MHKGRRLEIKPNDKQRTMLAQSSGVSRYAWNWMLGNINESYEQWKSLNNPDMPKPKLGTSIDWHKEWVILKQTHKWIYEVSKCCGQEALRDLEKAFKRFFAKKGGHPRFKKRFVNDHFRTTGSTWIDERYVHVPGIGRIRLKEKGTVDGKTKLTSVTVSRQADKWFVSFFIKEDDAAPSKPELGTITENEVTGIDLGCKDLAITSEGEIFPNPKPYRKRLKKLGRCQRTLSRKRKGSQNWKKAKAKLAKMHKKIADIRKDATHKFTSSVAKAKPKMVVIETLRPKNMAKNRKIAMSIMDSSFGEVVRQLEYKCEWNGIHLVKADAFYASSQYCSHCGKKNQDVKDLSVREWTCPCCDSVHDRDVNAALNLKFYGMWTIKDTASCAGMNACGDERLQFLMERCSSMKQESSIGAVA